MYIEHTPALGDSPRPLPVEPALESLLNQSMLRVDIVAELHYCGSWFMDEPRYDCGLFHLVGTGECQVESPALTEPATSSGRPGGVSTRRSTSFERSIR
jgi:AraC family transcriptional activator of mtrCDE